jgi:general secretion pathway protein G
MQINSRRTRKGFTLVELLVVILILGILAALIVPKLLSHQYDAKKAKAQSDMSEIKNALERFHIDADRYPTDQEGLTPLVTQPSDVTNWKGPYLDKLRLDPWDHDYVYKLQDEKTVLIESYGKDGVEGGSGEDSDITSDDETAPKQ